MEKDSLEVAIAAETVPYCGAGLGHYLLNAVRYLSRAEPTWRFKVVVTSTFDELAAPGLANVEPIVWDNGPLLTKTAVLMRRLHAGDPWAASYSIGQHVPSRRLRAMWGSIRDIWAIMRDVDAVWAPHFSILYGVERGTLFQNLRDVRAPILLTIHDIHPTVFPEDWSQESLDLFWNEFVPFAKSSDLIVTHALYHKEEIARSLGVEAGKIAVTPYAPLMDASVFQAESNEAEANAILSLHGISAPFAFYPATTNLTHKNHMRLILAWYELRKRRGRGCPMLVCTHKYENGWRALRKLIEILELDDMVVFTGMVSNEEMSTLYRKCLFVIVPTLYEGGGGGPVAEALLAGKPLLCSRIPPIEEHMEKYECTPQYFDPYSIDSIVRTVGFALEDFSSLESQAESNRSKLLPCVNRLWEEWARFYAERIREMVS